MNSNIFLLCLACACVASGGFIFNTPRSATSPEMDLIPKYNTTHRKLFTPPLTEFAVRLGEKLKPLYEHVDVSVVDCPDLTKKPFTLAGKGLGGRTAIADIGGVGFLMPVPVRPYKTYSLVKISQEIGEID